MSDAALMTYSNGSVNSATDTNTIVSMVKAGGDTVAHLYAEYIALDAIAEHPKALARLRLTRRGRGAALEKNGSRADFC